MCILQISGNKNATPGTASGRVIVLLMVGLESWE
jgi:hypothetical protein